MEKSLHTTWPCICSPELQESLQNLEREPTLAQSFSLCQEDQIRKVWSKMMMRWSLWARQTLLPYFWWAVIGIPISKHLKDRLASNSPDAKCSVKYLGPQGHRKYLPLLILVSSLYKVSLAFPLIHIDLLLCVLLTALHVCFTGRDRPGNTTLTLTCVYRNS